MKLKEVGLAGLEIMNEVANPPSITLQIPGAIHNRFKIYPLGAKADG